MTPRPIATFVAFMRQYCPNLVVAYATDGTIERGDRARLNEWERGFALVQVPEPVRERR